MFCDMQITDLGNGIFRHTCKRKTCKNSFDMPIRQPTLIACKALGLKVRAINFSRAFIAHITAGLPQCTQEEIDMRVAICRTCPLYKTQTPTVGYCTHEACGCSIKDMRGFVSKLAWPDQRCPRDPPMWDIIVRDSPIA